MQVVKLDLHVRIGVFLLLHLDLSHHKGCVCCLHVDLFHRIFTFLPIRFTCSVTRQVCRTFYRLTLSPSAMCTTLKLIPKEFKDTESEEDFRNSVGHESFILDQEIVHLPRLAPIKLELNGLWGYRLEHACFEDIDVSQLQHVIMKCIGEEKDQLATLKRFVLPCLKFLEIHYSECTAHVMKHLFEATQTRKEQEKYSLTGLKTDASGWIPTCSFLPSSLKELHVEDSLDIETSFSLANLLIASRVKLLVFSTGFETMTRPLFHILMRALDGVEELSIHANGQNMHECFTEAMILSWLPHQRRALKSSAFRAFACLHTPNKSPGSQTLWFKQHV